MFDDFQVLLRITFFALRSSSKGGGGDGVFRLLSADQRASLIEIFQRLEDSLRHCHADRQTSATVDQMQVDSDDPRQFFRGGLQQRREVGKKRIPPFAKVKTESEARDVCVDYLHHLLNGATGETGEGEDERKQKRSISSIRGEESLHLLAQESESGEAGERKSRSAPSVPGVVHSSSSGVHTPHRYPENRVKLQENEISTEFGKDLSSTAWQVIAWRNLRQIVWAKAASSSICPHCRR